MKTVPSIEILLGSDSNPLLLKYESEPERDAEFERIEAVLLGQPPVLFSMLALRSEHIQSMHIEWTGHMDTTLELRIKTPDTDTFVVRVTRDEEEDWKRAQELIAQFGLTVPKTTQERLEERRAKDYDENGNRKAGYYGGKL